MTNIWGFLLQTITLSVTALCILLIKKIFEDKLSPRWQYGIWGIFAIRLFLPVGVGRYHIIPLPLYMEYLKTKAESFLQSVYSGKLMPVRIDHVFPVIKEMPASITDVLFVLYTAGVLISLLWFLFSYIRLRVILKKQGTKVSKEMERELQTSCNEYFIKPCPVVSVEGLHTAFICGVIHPVLVVPAEDVLDKKILLHELLHKKHHDVLQNIFWCFVRCLHWCNPFIHYVCNSIENDMESLCDQRVLEILKGEERREYGALLLAMANERYARTPGTSSISNGGEFVKKRIESIVRFKKYPRGMALVSVCMLVVLAAFLIKSNSYEMAEGHSEYQAFSEAELDMKLAKTRIIRCSTAFGAIDTYAKGLMHQNGLYIAMASPINVQSDIREKILEGDSYWMYPSGIKIEDVKWDWGYRIYNLLPDGKGKYSGWLTFFTGEQEFYTETFMSNKLLIPIRVWEEDGSWVVKESGEHGYFAGYKDDRANFPTVDQVFVYGDYGKVTIHTAGMYVVEQKLTGSSNFGFLSSGNNISSVPIPDAEAEYVFETFVTYEYEEKRTKEEPISAVGILWYAPEWVSDQEKMDEILMAGNHQGSVGREIYYKNLLLTNPEWGGIISDNGAYEKEVRDLGKVEMPVEYKVRIYWDGELKEELTLKPKRAMSYYDF